MAKWFQMPVAAHLVLRRGNEVLMLLRQGTGYEDGNYSVVAGHFDGNEAGLDAMIREAREEAGIVIRRDRLEFGCVVHRKSADRECIDFFYTCRAWDGDITNMEPDKCGELRFVADDAIPENTIAYVRAGLRAVCDGVKYIEFGW